MSGTAEPATADDGLVAAALTLPLAIAHVAFSTWLSLVLFGWAGGIETEGRWTRYGGIESAYTSLAWLPGGLLVATGGPLAGIGTLLTFAGSGVAGYTLASAASRLVFGPRPRVGRWGWRAWGPVALWLVWLPVPVKGTVTYWHTVAY